MAFLYRSYSKYIPFSPILFARLFVFLLVICYSKLNIRSRQLLNLSTNWHYIAKKKEKERKQNQCVYFPEKSEVPIASVAMKYGCDQLKTMGYKTHILGVFLIFLWLPGLWDLSPLPPQHLPSPPNPAGLHTAFCWKQPDSCLWLLNIQINVSKTPHCRV